MLTFMKIPSEKCWKGMTCLGRFQMESKNMKHGSGLQSWWKPNKDTRTIREPCVNGCLQISKNWKWYKQCILCKGGSTSFCILGCTQFYFSQLYIFEIIRIFRATRLSCHLYLKGWICNFRFPQYALHQTLPSKSDNVGVQRALSDVLFDLSFFPSNEDCFSTFVWISGVK